MTPTVESHDLDRLPRADRLALVQAIWDTIAAEPPLAPPDAALRELERRADADDATPNDLIPWEHVKAAACRGVHP